MKRGEPNEALCSHHGFDCRYHVGGNRAGSSGFFRKSSLDAMDLTVFRMFSAGIIMFLVSLMKGQWKAGVRAVQRKPLLFLELIFYGIVGLMLMHYTYFASIAAGNAAAATVIQYTCPAMVILWVSLKIESSRPGVSFWQWCWP